MEKDYLDEKHLFQKEQQQLNLRKSLNWVLTLLCIEVGISLIYFLLDRLIIPSMYGDPATRNYAAIGDLYEALSFVFVLVYATMFTLGAIMVKHNTARTLIIIMGAFHIIRFLSYQFLD